MFTESGLDKLWLRSNDVASQARDRELESAGKKTKVSQSKEPESKSEPKSQSETESACAQGWARVSKRKRVRVRERAIEKLVRLFGCKILICDTFCCENVVYVLSAKNFVASWTLQFIEPCYWSSLICASFPILIPEMKHCKLCQQDRVFSYACIINP